MRMVVRFMLYFVADCVRTEYYLLTARIAHSESRNDLLSYEYDTD